MRRMLLAFLLSSSLVGCAPLAREHQADAAFRAAAAQWYRSRFGVTLDPLTVTNLLSVASHPRRVPARGGGWV